jgi:alanyl-tRNA synthetase
MGETGPCGPCSEIHYDRIGGRNAAKLVNADDPDVLEIWNLVFIQYNREADRSLRSLPNKHVDTGMGFERLVSVLQDKRSNYDTDVFQPLFERIQAMTGARPYAGKLGDEDEGGIDMAYRVVADHVRTLTFALSDNGVPSNVGRGYVLRRILRRGARYVRNKFNVPIGHFFSDLSPTLVAQLGAAFPELADSMKQASVKHLLDKEESAFSVTLDRGERQFQQYVAAAQSEGRTSLHGRDVWRLYDTYGFPVDLTELMARELDLAIDAAEFEAAQLASKEASKGAGKQESDRQAVKLDVHDTDLLRKLPGVSRTRDEAKYGAAGTPGKVVAIYTGQPGGFPSSSEGLRGSRFGVVLDETCFYAESGGQVCDTGVLAAGKTTFRVDEVKAYGSYVLHVGELDGEHGELRVGDEVTATYDEDRRWPIRNNHTGTHILNLALREVLGAGRDQKGSLVAPDRLRFDFTQDGAIPHDKLTAVEGVCNGWVKRDVEVYSKELPLEAAYAIPGLRAVFGEAYPDPVRVVAVGTAVDEIAANIENERWREYSVEFCGGTCVTLVSGAREDA